MPRPRSIAPNAALAGYALFLRSASLLPNRQAFGAASGLGRLWYRRRRAGITAAQRQTFARCLDATPHEVDEGLARAFASAACEDLEIAQLGRLTAQNLPQTIDLRGREHLDQALARGRGAILVSGHLRGHFTFFAALGVLGYRPNVLGQGTAPDHLAFAQRRSNRRTAIMRDRLGCRFLFMESANFGVAVQAANALRRNEVVTIEIDHTHSTQNIETSFFGRPGRFPLGPFLLAQTSGAPLLDFFLHRDERRTPLIAEIGPGVPVDGDPTTALRYCVGRLEAGIRRHPASWAPWLFPSWNVWE